LHSTILTAGNLAWQQECKMDFSYGMTRGATAQLRHIQCYVLDDVCGMFKCWCVEMLSWGIVLIGDWWIDVVLCPVLMSGGSVGIQTSNSWHISTSHQHVQGSGTTPQQHTYMAHQHITTHPHHPASFSNLKGWRCWRRLRARWQNLSRIMEALRCRYLDRLISCVTKRSSLRFFYVHCLHSVLFRFYMLARRISPVNVFD
jgi:hypothetical protein